MYCIGNLFPPLILVILAAPLDALLFPLLFPLSVKITISRRPTHAPAKSYHFDAEPIYREVSVKGHAPHPPYGSGAKYGTSHAGGHVKVYTGEPHLSVRSKYFSGHISGLPTINGHISITSDPVPPSKSHISITSGTTIETDPHYKGTPYVSAHVKGTAYEAPPELHHKGTPYKGTADVDVHFKGTPYKGSDDADVHYKGTPYKGSKDVDVHLKGTPYDAPPKTTYKVSADADVHYKGTPYDDPPKTAYKNTDDADVHYKGTPYDDAPPKTHYKGSAGVDVHYDDAPPKTHYKGTAYDDDDHAPHLHVKGHVGVEPPAYYKGDDVPTKPKPVYKEDSYNYIKSVGSGYKLADYVHDDADDVYDDRGYVAIPPSRSFADMKAAHEAANAHRLGGGAPKAYAAEEYADLGGAGAPKYNKEYEHGFLDDTLPEYKATVPKPKPKYGSRRKIPDFRYEASSTKYSKVAPAPKEKKVYAGFGTSVYGDSYARMVYVPRSLRVTIRTHGRK